ncbi:MAG: oligopeptide transporter, OPT family [Simkaniaceae bacterium]|nr:oligopeptide transporter, OPT family [Simkaniaceae bacterium]
MEKEESFTPVVADETHMREFSLKAIILGVILGVVFAIGNAYVGLKVGLTISASIPAAVMSMGILRLLFRRVTILENNIVQTVAAVGGGIASGAIFTVPALFLLGFEPMKWNIFLLTFLGGILGILFMIPMRRYIIVKEHGILPFPEGTACAEILKAGDSGTKSSWEAWVGLAVGAIYQACTGILHFWQTKLSLVVKSYQRTEVNMECTPVLLGVGFIIGPRVASIMFVGGAISWWVFIPLIRLFGQGDVLIYPSTIPIGLMSADDIWSSYVRYIGAGTIAIGGLLSLFKIGPVIFKTIHVGFKELFQGLGSKNRPRTDRDISLSWLILGSLAIILFLWLYPGLQLNLLTVVLLVILGYFFVAVTSVTVGLVGSSSNPVSGMTITTLLITSLIFLAIGWTERAYLISAIVMSIVANVAISLAGTTSQDLKTGFLLGATPIKQQIAEIIGLVIPCIAIGFTIYLLNDAYKFGSTALPAPQATLMALIAKGVILGKLPLTLVAIGVVIGIILEILRIPILPFAIGLYLPLELSTAIMVGGIVSGILKYGFKNNAAIERGILLASGLVAGDACMGVVIALLTVLTIVPEQFTPLLSQEFGLAFYLLLALGLGWLARPTKAT